MSDTVITNRSSTGGGGGGHQGSAVVTFIGGVSLPEHLEDAATSLQFARQDGFDYVVTSLPDTVSVSREEEAHSSTFPGGVHCRTDVTRLESKWWSTSVVGMVSDPLHWKKVHQHPIVGDAATAPINEGRRLMEALTSTSTSAAATRKKEEASKMFWGMMEWASHMSIPAVILPPVPLWEHADDETTRGSAAVTGPTSIHSSEEEDMFAPSSGEAAAANQPKNKRGRIRHIQGRFMTAEPPRAGSVASPVPPATAPSVVVNRPNASAKEYAGLLSRLATSPVTAHVQLWIRVPLSLSSLAAFQLLLARCDGSPHVGCVLCISQLLEPAELPAVTRALHAFLGGGHVKAVSWDTEAFLKNRKGYPTLSKIHQSLFVLLYGRLGRTLRTLIEGVALPGASPLSQPGHSQRLHHLQYLRHLRSNRFPLATKLDTPEAVLETPYLDNLQVDLSDIFRSSMLPKTLIAHFPFICICFSRRCNLWGTTLNTRPMRRSKRTLSNMRDMAPL